MKQLLLVTSAAIAAFAIACGGGGASGTPTPVPTLPPDFTPQPPGLLTPSPPPQINPNVDLTPYTNPDPKFTISAPPGWDIENTPDSTRIAYTTSDKGLVAQTTIYCAVTLDTGASDPLAVLRADADLLIAAKAPVTPGKSRELTINGRQAYEFPYSVSFGASSAFQFVYYVAGDACTWRIRNVVYGTTAGDGYERLFDRMAASFVEAH